VGRYREKELGLADDFRDADGKRILTFEQAQKFAFEWSDNGRQEALTGPLTVAKAVQGYLTNLEHQGRSTADAKIRADLHILPSLGSELVERLSTERLQRWLAEIAKLPPRVRRKKFDRAPRYKTVPEDADSKRRRRSTANRVLTILKAALNYAFDAGHVKSNAAWGRRLKPFRQVDAARQRFLSVNEARRLVDASGQDFRKLVQAALVTGARYGELTRLKVRDFNPDSDTVAILQSKGGKPRHVHLTQEGTGFFEQLTVGRAGDEILLTKTDGTAWGRSEQLRPMAAAVRAARIDPNISFHTTRHSYASLSVMAGVPLHVVARNLGHSDTRMVERHYGHLADSYLLVTNAARKLVLR
jgi:integrase